MVEDYTVQALTPMRKIIAARMTEALRTIPHFRLVVDVEIDALLDLRTELRQRRPAATLSINDLLIKACASALMDVPAVNVQWTGDEIRCFRGADISVVTAMEGGLATPIIFNAGSKSVWQISREVRDLGARAKKGELKMSEIVGGSFSISNLGMHGIDQFDAIINPPQCAILAVGAAKPQVLASRTDASRVATLLTLTLSIDHRAIDGTTAASFLSTLRETIEHPEQLRPRGND